MTPTAVRLRFEGLLAPFTAISWQIPNHDSDFEPLPADATTLHIPRKRGLFINRKSDRRMEEVSVEQAKNWGKNDARDTELIFAQARTPTAQYCVRLVLNAEKFHKRKNSNRYQVLDRLMEDAQFHSTHLADCEGWLVPVHHGMWFMETGDWAGKVLFSITQWCGLSWHELSYTRMNTEANRILVGRTFEALHDAGFCLGDLRWRDAFRHVIIDIDAPGLSLEDLLNGKAPCRLVGFSEAEAGHSCLRRVPILPLDCYLSPKEVGCEEPEVADILVLINFTKRANASVPAAKALEWYSTYVRRYPEQDRLAVRIAQRERLYPGVPSVYPNDVTVSFEGDDEYSRARVMRTFKIDSDELTADR
ncbi:hypothetical protein C8R47DRAFT_1192579 [Mycena vitilis]|nr:hypothetical protein C8R47DRAFT_1192579 [Mycena vitilis]